MSLIEKIEEMKAQAQRLIINNPADRLDEIANDISEGYITACDEIKDFILSEQNEPIRNTEQLEEPCGWCKENYRFEFNWVDEEGNTIVTEDNIVIGGVAEHCPVCGRPLNQPYTDSKIN